MEQIEFEHHVSSLRPRLVRCAQRYHADDADIEDAVQETLVKLWQLRARIADGDHMTRLALVVLRNTSISMLRSQKSHPTQRLDLMIHDQPSASSSHKQLETAETDQWLRLCIRSLPDKQRAILQMRNVDQLSYAEIARILGSTESSVRGLISRARATLLSQLKRQ